MDFPPWQSLGLRPAEPVAAGDHGGGMTGEQQGFIAHLRRVMAELREIGRQVPA